MMSNDKSLDPHDLEIIQILRADPQVTNKTIAQRLGISEPAVASRVRAMSKNNIMRVTAQRDLFSLGYDIMCLAYIHVAGRQASEIATDLAKIEDIISVSLCVGNADILINILARDRKHLRSIVEGQIGSVTGVQLVDTHICLEILKFHSGHGELAVGKVLGQGGEPDTDGDTDLQIITALQMDGRTSNREIARRLNVSEGTIRKRLKRLIESKSLRLGVVCDPRALGVGTVAYVTLAVQPDKANDVISALVILDEINFVGAMSGLYNITLLVETGNNEDLSAFCAVEIRTLPGVMKISTLILSKSHKHRYDLIRIK